MTTRKQPPPGHKTPTQLLAEIALTQAGRKPAEPVSKVGLAQNAKGEWRSSVEVAHADPFEAAKIATAIADVLDARNGGQQA